MSHTRLLSAALALLLLAGSGCVSEPPEAEYFAGQLSVSGDTVRLCDCATGRTHPVVDNEMRDEAVTRYEKIVNDPPRTIVMACKGQLTAGRSDAPDSLRIDRLLSLGSDDSDRFLLVGFYESETRPHLSADRLRRKSRKHDERPLEPDVRTGTDPAVRNVPPAPLRNPSEPRNADRQ